LALGEIGLSYDGFYSLTPRSFTNIVNGFRNRQYEEAKISWEQTRYLFYATLKPHLKGNPSLKKIMPLPWDSEEIEDEKEIIETAEQAEQILQEQTEYWANVDRKRQLKSNAKNDYDGISTDKHSL